MSGDTTNVGPRVVASILVDPDRASLKRIAWAFGCAKKDSDEETKLYRVLVEQIEKRRKERIEWSKSEVAP